WGAVRHLHTGNDSCGRVFAGEKTGARARRHTRGTCGKSLPLHGLHADFRSGVEGSAAKSYKMRSDPAEYKLVSPGNLPAVLSLLAGEPAQWLPIAGWTGGIANQNRGTLGGNIANASPAADSLPALLAYEAELTLISVRGERRVAYRNFHTGYKQTVLAADELIRDISLPRRFSGYLWY